MLNEFSYRETPQFKFHFQDMFRYNTFFFRMSNFLGMAEAILTTGLFVEGVTTAVLKKQISDLVAKYQPEFDCIKSLYDQISKLAIFRLLLSQLKTSMTFSADQWAAIASDLDDRKEFFDTLMTKMNNINMPTDQNKWSDYTSVFFEGFGAVALWNLYAKQTDFVKFSQSLYKWCSKNRVQPVENQASISPNEAQIQIELQSRNLNPVEINQQIENIHNPQDLAEDSPIRPKQVSSKVWNRCTLGMHFVVIVGMSLGVIAGIIDIVDLVKEKKKLDKVFSSTGDFKQVQLGVIQLTKFVSINLYQLSNTSKIVLTDLSKLFLTKSVLTPKYFDKLYQIAKNLTPIKFKITDTYIQNSQNFMKSVVQKANGGDSDSDKLYGIKDLYDSFMSKQKPQEIMLSIAQILSQTIGNYSLSSGEIDQFNNTNYRFLYKTCTALTQRNTQILQKTTDDDRKNLDKTYLTKIVESYNKIFQDGQQINLQSPTDRSKKLLYYTIGLFSNNFYYDDKTGKTIYGLQFSKIQDLETYGDFFKNFDETVPKYLVISYSDSNKEVAAQNEYVTQVKKLSGDNNSTVHPLYRYITYINVDNPDQKDEQKKKYVKNIEGMKYTLNEDKVTIKSIQRDFQKQNYYLVQ